ncbi:hypothetical protein FB45DRAFT_1053412 [Roridomyces roridus]|uniref:F-box domain-containing protein n=1 Tax=Roridomyces roridus TaxID=1738132 RepID=A0AAD7CC67_9AGAR|nr:hypothetical protein FB45DRAFT_1053412 [Roridomyces roridus]
MSAHERVPNELWLEIFGLIPQDSLKHIHATDRKFANVSRALLFSHLVFHPYHLDQVERRLTLPSPDGVQLALDRLNFWSSDDISPYVRECTIAPRCWRAGEAGSVLLEHTDSPHILMISFMDLLAKFTALKKLSARQAHFTQAGLVSLCQLPLLTELATRWCDIVPGETIDATSLQLRTTKLLHHADVGVAWDEDKLCTLWLSIVHRECLQELQLTGSGSGFEGPAFPNVSRLGLGPNFSTMNRNLATLSRFPAVRKLWLQGLGEFQYQSTDASSLHGHDVLPLLQEYSGSWKPLHMFLPKPTLACLDIHFCTPEELSSQLREEYRHITSLYATLIDLDQQTLNTICTCLPELTELHIRIYTFDDAQREDGFNPKATSFFSTFGTTLTSLPPTLKRLAIAWEFEFESDDAQVVYPGPKHIPDFLAMRDKLRKRCPALRTLWLDGHHFIFRWRQLLDREEMEQQNEIKATEIENLRERFKDFWEGR